MEPLKGRHTMRIERKAKLKRQGFLDDLAYEAVEDPYQFDSIDEAVNHLTSKYSLAFDEIVYLKKRAKANKIDYVENQRKRKE